MRIAIIAPKVYPVFNVNVEETYGGAEIALSLVARELSKLSGKDIYILVGDYGQDQTEIFEKITLHRSLSAEYGTLRNGLELLRAINKVDAQIYVQRTLTAASALIALYCRVIGRRFIYWVAHDSETDGGHPLYRRAVTRFLVQLLFRTASLVIVQNNYEKEQLVAQYPGMRCAVIKKGIELPENASSGESDYDAVWVGRCDVWKNPEDFLRLAEAYPDRKFLMICPSALGKESLHQKIVSAASHLDNLDMRDRTRHSYVLALVGRSKVFCITSSQEGDWPNVVLEAASLKRPVLSLHLDYEGLVSDFQGGTSCDGNFELFSKEFGRLMDDQTSRIAMGNGAYRYVKNIHDVEIQTEKLVRLINELD